MHVAHVHVHAGGVPTVISMTMILLLCIYTASPPLKFNGSRIDSISSRKVLPCPYYGSCDVTKTEVFTCMGG